MLSHYLDVINTHTHTRKPQLSLSFSVSLQYAFSGKIFSNQIFPFTAFLFFGLSRMGAKRWVFKSDLTLYVYIT